MTAVDASEVTLAQLADADQDAAAGEVNSDVQAMDSADAFDSTADAADGSEAYVGSTPSVCNPGKGIFYHDAAYDYACAGNTTCKELVCQACATSCGKCDGPYCVQVVSDDSCLIGPSMIQGWAPEPLVGLPMDASQVQLTKAIVGNGQLALTVPPALPTTLHWQPVGGAMQKALLAQPVKVIADLGLAHAKGSVTNYCTGQTISGSVGPALYPANLVNGKLTFAVPLGSGLGWQVKAAWLRVYEDGAGLRAVQWIQPGASGTPLETNVTYPFPLSAATPVDVDGKAFDWAKALEAGLSAP